MHILNASLIIYIYIICILPYQNCLIAAFKLNSFVCPYGTVWNKVCFTKAIIKTLLDEDAPNFLFLQQPLLTVFHTKA